MPFNKNFANFSGISDSLYISKVIYQAVVEVNEEGTEAAAAAIALVNVRKSYKVIEIEEFRCNRPFLFMIQANDGILFIGKYTQPE